MSNIILYYWTIILCYKSRNVVVAQLQVRSYKEGKDQESIQSSATPNPGHNVGK